MALTDDRFKKFEDVLESPGKFAFQIVPEDMVDLAIPTRAIYVGASGNLCVRLVGNTTFPSDTEVMGQNVEFINVVAGTILPIRVAQVQTTNTTAQHLVGLY